MSRIMAINAGEAGEVRIAVTGDGRLEDFYVERTSHATLVGNIYKARIVNVHAALQAAFVDIGLEKNAFMHVTETANPPNWKRRWPRLIQDLVEPGQEALVQVIRDGFGEKGPSVTMEISVPHRYLVLVPTAKGIGVSKKIEDPLVRESLRAALRELDPPTDVGVIIRTASEEVRAADLRRDLSYLTRLWRAIEERARRVQAPTLIYQESDLTIRTIRDLFTPEIDRVLIDSREVHAKVSEFFRTTMPTYLSRVELYEETTPLFHSLEIEKQIENIHGRSVPLPSGGSIIIEQTEAMSTIDVNSGSYKSARTPEANALHTNLEAAEEIAHQLRLRDLGGIIVVDFIDMAQRRNIEQVERALLEALKKDKAQYTVTGMSQFCLVEMARQKVRPTLSSIAFEKCPTCEGTGVLKTAESVTLSLFRELRSLLAKEDVARVEVRMSPQLGRRVRDTHSRTLIELEKAHGKAIQLLFASSLGPDELEIAGFTKSGEKV